MIFELLDGRTHLYQWDIDRQLKVNDPSIKEVHFCNRTDVCSLVVEVNDGIANIPNKLLQSGFNIRVFGYDGKATLHEVTLEVKARTRPVDYVYTETEIKQYSDLEARIDEIEKNGISEEVIDNAVNKFLEENPIDLTGYATEEYVNEAINNIEIPEVDLSDYATKSYVSEEVAKAVTGGEIDLSGYAKKEDIPDVSDFISEIPSEYITESELNDKKYATESYVDEAIANIEISGGGGSGSTLYNHHINISSVNIIDNNRNKNHSVNILVTNSSKEAFTEESFKTFLQEGGYTSKENYFPATGGILINRHLMETIDAAGDYPSEVIGVYCSSTSTIIAVFINPDATGELNPESLSSSDGSKFTFVDKVLKVGVAAGGSGESADLTNYYTKEEVDGLIPDVSKFISEVPAEYITETELNDKGYLTEHQSLEEYAKKTELFSKDYNDLNNKPTIPSIEGLATEQYVNDAIANIDIPEGGGSADLSNYYTKDETYSRTEVDEAIAGAGGSSGGGGASYTFTNGLTETDGTVSWDYSNTFAKYGIYNGLCISGHSLEGLATTAHGALATGYAYQNNQNCIVAGGQGAIAAGYGSASGSLTAKSLGTFVGGYSLPLYGMESTGPGAISYGWVNQADGSRAMGANGWGSAAFGRSTLANSDCQTAIGKFNVADANDTYGLIVGNGSTSGRSNALTVSWTGNVVAAGTVTPTGADYAEYFEFEDGNPNREDRIGYLVELSGAKVKLANGTDILGAVSGTKGVIGDAEEMNWQGKYERDEFGRYIYEDYDETYTLPDNDGVEHEYIKHVHEKKISADYDPDKTYIPRSIRKEWAPIGLLGKLLVRHDGTLSAGDYVKAINGIATKASEKTNIRVLEVISDNIIKVLIK